MATVNQQISSGINSGGLAVNNIPQGNVFAGPIAPGTSTQAFRATGVTPVQTGNTLGITTSNGNGNSAPANNAPNSSTTSNSQPQADPYAQIRSGISSAWDSYLGSLNDIGNTYLPQQQAAQTGIADSQLQQGQQTIQSQKASSLRDIANTTRNAFQAGNNYLGSMGAGDSSAANQYGFAINQQAGKQTGDLNNFVSTQMNTLQNTHDQQINQIANWFSQQQESLKQQMAQGTLQKGQDLNSLSTNILNQAIAATNAVKANTQNQYNALVQWAANNSGNLGQLQQNIASIPQAMGQLSTFGGGQANPTMYGGYSANNTPTKTDIFGNPIQ